MIFTEDIIIKEGKCLETKIIPEIKQKVFIPVMFLFNKLISVHFERV